MRSTTIPTRWAPLFALLLSLTAFACIANASIIIETTGYFVDVGDAHDLEKFLRTKIRKLGDDPFALHDLGTVLYRQKQVDAARRLWNEAANKESEVASANVEIIFQLLAEGKIDAAQIALSRAMQRTPDDYHVFLAQAQLAIRQRDLAAAAESFEKALSLAPMSFTANLSYGKYLEMIGDIPKAQQFYQSGAEIRPEKAISWFLLASSEFRLGNVDDCLEHLYQAEKIQPDDTLPEARMAEMYLGARDYVSAYQWYVKAEERDADELLVKVRVGQMLTILRKNEKAREALASIVAEHEFVPALVALAQLEESEGNWIASAKLYRRVLQQDDDNVLANNNLAMLHVQMGESAEEALELVDKARQLMPNTTNIESTYGCVLSHAGKHKEAIEVLRQSVRSEPTDAWVRFCYGQSLHSDGNKEDARWQLEACLLLDENFSEKSRIEKLISNRN